MAFFFFFSFFEKINQKTLKDEENFWKTKFFSFHEKYEKNNKDEER